MEIEGKCIDCGKEVEIKPVKEVEVKDLNPKNCFEINGQLIPKTTKFRTNKFRILEMKHREENKEFKILGAETKYFDGDKLTIQFKKHKGVNGYSIWHNRKVNCGRRQMDSYKQEEMQDNAYLREYAKRSSNIRKKLAKRDTIIEYNRTNIHNFCKCNKEVA